MKNEDPFFSHEVHPELQKGLQQAQNMEEMVHALGRQYLPNVWLSYIGAPLLLWIASMIAIVGVQFLLDGVRSLHFFLAALGVACLLLSLGIVVVVGVVAWRCFWAMNPVGKVVSVLLIADIVWWAVKTKLDSNSFPLGDTIAAFITCAITEMIWKAWRSRRGDDEWA